MALGATLWGLLMADAFAHDTWLYGDEAPEGRLFLAGETIPASGWVDAPSKLKPADKDATIAALRSEVAKMDPDGDGKIGGRRKIKTTLTDVKSGRGY